MEQIIPIAALIVAVVAAGIALWQGSISREQLRLARDTEQRTERALEEIRRVTNETRQITQDVKNDVDSQISKIIDSKLSAEQNSQAMGQQFLTRLLQGMGQPKPPSAE